MSRNFIDDAVLDEHGYFNFPKDKTEEKRLEIDCSKIYYTTITVPKYSKWKCTIAGSLTYYALEGQEPNWFNRLMQSVILGFNWKKD